jgi:hypothetical protein
MQATVNPSSPYYIRMSSSMDLALWLEIDHLKVKVYML